MNKLLSIGLSPNTERDDIVLASKLLKRPQRLVKGQAVKELENKFREMFGKQHVFAARSGRSALYMALSAMKLKPDDEVLLQSYTCAAVPSAVLWAGGMPIYVDIESDTLNMSPKDFEKKINAKSRAVIVQHTFGLPANIKKIIGIARKRGLIVIEDCAHILGGEYNGGKVGSLGDISIFSFGRDKVISGVSGGMLVANDEILGRKIMFVRGRMKLPSAIWTIKNLLHPILMNRVILPTYSKLSIGKAILETVKFLGILPKAVYKKEKFGEKEESMLGLMPNALAMLTLHQLKKLDKFNLHRQKIAEIYNRTFKDIAGKRFQLPERENNGSVWLRYTIITPQAKQLIAEARKENIVLGDWYRPAIAPHGTNYEKLKYDPSTCPAAELASAYSINLPTHINISTEDAERIARLIKNKFKNAS